MPSHLEKLKAMLTARNTRALRIVLIVIAAALAVWLLYPRERAPWRPVTQVFDPARCAQGKCEEWVRMPPLGDDVVSLIVDPDVDDEVAQWSDCLGSVAKCLDEAGDYGAKALRHCVQVSRCPERCREEFSRNAGSLADADQVWALYNAEFVNDGGLCVP